MCIRDSARDIDSIETSIREALPFSAMIYIEPDLDTEVPLPEPQQEEGQEDTSPDGAS